MKITIHGEPIPKGSMKAMRGVPFGPACSVCREQKRGFPRVFSDNSALKGWEKTVRVSAMVKKAKPIEGPIEIRLSFFLPRPKAHFGTGRNAGKVKPSAPKNHTSKPDVDKLARAVLDGLTGTAWGDDAQVETITATKQYAEQDKERAEVEIIAAHSQQGRLFE